MRACVSGKFVHFLYLCENLNTMSWNIKCSLANFNSDIKKTSSAWSEEENTEKTEQYAVCGQNSAFVQHVLSKNEESPEKPRITNSNIIKNISRIFLNYL